MTTNNELKALLNNYEDTITVLEEQVGNLTIEKKQQDAQLKQMVILINKLNAELESLRHPKLNRMKLIQALGKGSGVYLREDQYDKVISKYSE